MTAGVVVGSILLAADQHLGVEELAVATSTDLVDRGRVQVDEERSRNMLAAASLREEGLEGTRITDIFGVRVGATVSAEAVLEEVAIVKASAWIL